MRRSEPLPRKVSISVKPHATFGWLVVAQGAHSVEEYLGRLWESFPPARYITGVVSSDRELGFIVTNTCLIAFGVACFLWPVRRRWASAAALMWFWVVIETINGVVHPLWSVRQGGYTPGVLTAPVLLVLALYLGRQLSSERDLASGTGASSRR